MEVLKIYVYRSHYSATEAAGSSLTVGELKEILNDYDDNTPIVTCNTSDFCKYGRLSRQSIEADYGED